VEPKAAREGASALPRPDIKLPELKSGIKK